LQKKDLPWNDMAGFGTMYKFSLPLAAPGLFALAKAKGSGKALALAGLAAGVFAGLATNGVNINRVNLVFYFVLLLIVLGLEVVTSRIKQSAAPAIGIFLCAGIMMLSGYFGSYADSIKHHFYWGFGEALERAEESGAEHIYVTADAQAKGYWNVSEILTLFYDETDAVYFQGKSNENHGEQLLPYYERFRYTSMGENTGATAPESTAFVIRNADIPFFPKEEYNFSFHGDFVCVTKK
jgi:hypothetical protein